MMPTSLASSSASAQLPLSTTRIEKALYGFTRSQMVFCAIDLEIFGHIAGGRTRMQELIEVTRCHPRGLQIFLDGLVGMGFLNKSEDQVYGLPEDIARFMVPNSPEYLGGMVHHCRGLYENWMQLNDVVRTGQPAGGAQSLAMMEAQFAELAQGLAVSNLPTAQQLATLLLQERPGNGLPLEQLSILDVAGGSAVWSLAVLQQDATAQTTVLDYPTVMQVAQASVQSLETTMPGVSQRVHYWPADLELADFPKQTYDLALLGHICHALGPHSVKGLLQQVAYTLKPGGLVAIVDFIPGNSRNEAGFPLLFGVNMLISTEEGNVFTQAEYTDWLTQAGFLAPTAIDLGSDTTVILAQIPPQDWVI